ncbi:hypothetical protein HYH03_017024 [Edaphochlamys debaryana]|uniref:Major facilitator superfamily (MFS) profile domain-containing protein n=1 Tax=Edaphochlamys debaryana TaxID=47281 RepID=A0A835XGE7_9CHLO|nr:hypothetical protein HYH03_017024 [Edaphochlamys debaryana]|eukprot:KAG2484142.1 hypothetical protein HYH03_017024 [Edaphochlamys debaryana]
MRSSNAVSAEATRRGDDACPGETPSPRNDVNGVVNGVVWVLEEDEDEHDTHWVDEALVAVGVGWHQAALFAFVGLAWMSDAMEVMLVAVLAPAIGCEWGASPEAQSLLASAAFTGMMLASSAWGMVADLAGRKRAFAFAAALAATSGLVSSVAPSLALLVAARVAVGAGLVGVLPLYTLMEEWLPRGTDSSRGKWLVAFQAWWSVGTVLEALLALALLNTWGWRALLAASALPLGCVLLLLPLVPESPHYLAVSRGATATGGAAARAAAESALLAAARRNGTTEALRRCLSRQRRRQQRRQEAAGGAKGPGGDVSSRSCSTIGAGEGTDRRTSLEVECSAGSAGAASRPLLAHAHGGGGGPSDAATILVEADSSGAGLTEASRSEAGGCCGGCFASLASLISTLFSERLRGRTWRLAVVWFACALVYYATVMLAPTVAAGAAAMGPDGGGGMAGDCRPWPGGGGGSHLQLPTGAYLAIMVAAAAELPSLVWAFLAVDRWSRRRVVAVGLAATAAALAPLAMVTSRAAGLAAAPPGAPPPPGGLASASAFTTAAASDFEWPDLGSLSGDTAGPSPAGYLPHRWIPFAAVTGARLFVSGAFTLLYVLTPEQYPARVHGVALGAANTLARVGALAAPFVAVALPARGLMPAAVGLLTAACGVAALAALGLPEAGT